MRHKHNLSHYRLLTGDMGLLYPIGLVEVLPKDTFQHSASVFLRMSPMAAPVMHPVSVRVHHFYVPHRLSWPESDGGGFENFITGGADGNDDQRVPTLATSGEAGDLCDYFGLPVVEGSPVSVLPFRAYNAVYNEYYRDQDLAPLRDLWSLDVERIAWEKDYLTTCRPWTQKGDAVSVPVGGQAPVHGIGMVNQTYGAGDTAYEADGTTAVYASGRRTSSTPPEGEIIVEEDPNNPGFPNIYADLGQATSVNINDFRRAFALQRFQEARARYGSRYTEYLRYLGVRPSDARLQRPEYLGGGKVRISISEVLQTNNETGGAVDRFGTGDMYGHGVAHMRSNAYRRTFEEHGYVLSLLSVRPKAMYLNGISRHWLRRDKEEFWQKELEHIGQQEVWRGEVFSDGSSISDRILFGYQDRYREYREEPSQVSSEFKDVLKYWHLGREFTEHPTLNQSFIECNPSKRIFNEQTQHSLWMAVQHNLVARRLVSRNASARIL